MADVHIRIDRRALVWIAASVFLGAAGVELATESLTLSTYYPAPSGVYNKIITTQDAYLARDHGNVGVGTTSPGAKLEVFGDIRLAGATTSYRIINIADPINNSDAVNKAYVDAAVASAGGGGGLVNSITFNSPTQNPVNWTVPPGVSRILLEVWGSGGSGGRSSGCGASPPGGGGGAGGYGRGLFSLAPGSVLAVTVGGGASRVADSGGHALISAGGGSDGASSDCYSPGPGGTGGTSSAPFNFPGQAGQAGTSGGGGGKGGNAYPSFAGGPGGYQGSSGQTPGGGGGGGSSSYGLSAGGSGAVIISW